MEKLQAFGTFFNVARQGTGVAGKGKVDEEELQLRDGLEVGSLDPENPFL